MTELDREILEHLQRQHPRAAIRVLGGFLDGWGSHLNPMGAAFGSYPDDWDGTVLIFDFRKPLTLSCEDH